jgi:hypothetical protein
MVNGKFAYSINSWKQKVFKEIMGVPEKVQKYQEPKERTKTEHSKTKPFSAPLAWFVGTGKKEKPKNHSYNGRGRSHGFIG